VAFRRGKAEAQGRSRANPILAVQVVYKQPKLIAAQFRFRKAMPEPKENGLGTRRNGMA